MLQEKVLYFDTNSVMYVSPTGEHLIIPDSNGALGLWTSKLNVDDNKYRIRVCCSKGFSLQVCDTLPYGRVVLHMVEKNY